jgi:hypothetical protein
MTAMAEYTSSVTKPFEEVVRHWRARLQKAIDYKRKHFDEDAKEIRTYLKGGKDLTELIYGKTSGSDFVISDGEGRGFPRPDFCINTNRVAELLDLFGPHLYHRNPHRQVNPREQLVIPQELFAQPMQMMPGLDLQLQQQMQQQMQQQQEMMYQNYLQEVNQADTVSKTKALLQQTYVNWTPNVLGLKDHMRMCIMEAIVTGLGVMVSEPFRLSGSNMTTFGSFFDSTDNHVIEPDMESIEDAKVWFRRKIRPVWEFEEMYTIPAGLPRGYLKGNASSSVAQSAIGTQGIDAFKSQQGELNDLMVVWEVYSKMGMGARLKGANDELRSFQDSLGSFGDNVYLVLCGTCPLPLNLIGAQDGEDLQRRLRWPTPYWMDDTWPFTPFQFHPQSRCVWPYSHVKPGLGELRFLSWCYSFIAGKIRNTCRDFIAVLKTAAAEIKQTILSGGDLSMLEISASDGGNLKVGDIIQFLQHPAFNGDIWKVLQAIEQQFERRVGLTPLLYGEAPTQARLESAAQFQQARGMVRIEDMQDAVEEGATAISRKEGVGAAYHLIPERDVAPVLGQMPARLWGEMIEFSDLIHGMQYRIEAGSVRKPNRERDATNAVTALQTLAPIFQQWAAMTGDPTAINTLVERWAKAEDFDPKGLQLQPPPPPQQPSPEEMEMQLKAQESQLKTQESQMDMQMKQAEFGLKQQEQQASLQSERQLSALDLLKGRQELLQQRAKGELELQQMKAKGELAIKLQKQQAAAKPKPKASTGKR